MPYCHLTADERYLINHLVIFGVSKREIARRLNRSAGTITRELQRNSLPDDGGYWNHRAHDMARARQTRPRGPRRLRAGTRLTPEKPAAKETSFARSKGPNSLALIGRLALAGKTSGETG